MVFVAVIGLLLLEAPTDMGAEIGVENEAELIETMDSVVPGIPMVIELKNSIKLSSLKTLEIKSGMIITLTGDHTLTGVNGYAVITVSAGGTLTISGITVTHEEGDKGNGVCVGSNATLNMTSGSIKGNTSNTGGGGVLNYGTFNMSGGTISDNTAPNYGGGVYNGGASAVFNLTGGKIVGNISNTTGSGVATTSSSTFNMSGDAVISGNTTIGIGGGVSVWDGSTFNMSGGTISDNKVLRFNDKDINSGIAAGVYVCFSSIFNMSGGTISGNVASYFGGAVTNFSDSIFNMSGGTISDNNGNIYGGGVHNERASLVMTGGEISGNTARYGGGVFNFLIEATFTMNGGVIANNTADNGAGVFNSRYSTFIFSKGEITGNKAAFYGGGLCDNLATIIIDGGVISGNTARSGAGVYNYNNSSFTMKGGEITGNTAAFYGGGVHNGDGATFTMDGGAVSKNTSNGIGGGIYGSNGTLSINGGTIISNVAKGANSDKGSGGGIFTENFSTLTVKDGVIFSGNKAPTMRIFDIGSSADIDGSKVSDLREYEMNIGKNVKLDAFLDRGQNAPAYNNYDINYPGDVKMLYIDIKPNGGGTVTVSYDTGDATIHKTITADGYIEIPAAVGSIALSAVPNNGYEFSQFITDDKSITDPDNVPMPGNMTIIAEFLHLSVPGHHDYYITASADSGSTITPSGTQKVPYGENKTFKFSAKPGYKITAVYVDDREILYAALASGEYTFRHVESNHTIRVVSEAGGGGGGDDETGTGDDGTGSDEIGSGNWAVLNLICAILAVFAGIVALIAGRNRIRKDKDENSTEKVSGTDEDERRRSKTAFIFRALALVFGIASVIVFFLTEDWNLPVVPMDGWTPLMFVLLLAALVLAMSSFGLDKDAEDEADSLE